MIIIHLARKPLARTEGSIVETTLHQGTGGLNIDACRLGFSAEYEQAGFGARFNPTGAAYMGNFQELLWAQRAVAEGRPISESKPHPGGRWPANLILEHTPECQCKGIATVKGAPHLGTKNPGAQKQYSGGSFGGGLVQDAGYKNADGSENVADWHCTPECPVAELDGQSGDSKSATGVQKYRQASTDTPWRRRGGMFAAGSVNVHQGMGDSGGASRFFKQVQVEKPEG